MKFSRSFLLVFVFFIGASTGLEAVNWKLWGQNYLTRTQNLLDRYRGRSFFGFGGLGAGLGYLAYRAQNPWLRYGAGIGAGISSLPALYAAYLQYSSPHSGSRYVSLAQQQQQPQQQQQQRRRQQDQPSEQPQKQQGEPSSWSSSQPQASPRSPKGKEREVKQISWGIYERQGTRPVMEDRFDVKLDFVNNQKRAFFGLYDGNGLVASAQELYSMFTGYQFSPRNLTKMGVEISEVAAHGYTAENEKIPSISTLIAEGRSLDNKNYKNAFLKFDKLWKKYFHGFESSQGKQNNSTGTMAVIADINFGDNPSAALAWVGDSRILVIENSEKFYITPEHSSERDWTEKKGVFKPGAWKNKEEYSRLQKKIGFMSVHVKDSFNMEPKDRTIAQGLTKPAATRMLGSGEPYDQFKIPKPQVKILDLQNYRAIVLACDGIFEYLTEKEVVKIITDVLANPANYSPPSPPENELTLEDGNSDLCKLVARVVVDEALRSGSEDNLSVIVIYLASVIQPSVPSHYVDEFKEEDAQFIQIQANQGSSLEKFKEDVKSYFKDVSNEQKKARIDVFLNDFGDSVGADQVAVLRSIADLPAPSSLSSSSSSSSSASSEAVPLVQIPVSESSIRGKRSGQEDAFHIQRTNDHAYFAVFDGHGGSGYSNLLAGRLEDSQGESLYNKIGNATNRNLSDIKEAIISAYKKSEFDNFALQEIEIIGGTTAVTAYITKSAKNELLLVVAWLGDSRALLISEDNGQYTVSATRDHHPDEPDEKARFTQLNIPIIANRVQGNWATSRSFEPNYEDGNGNIKNPKSSGISTDPEFASKVLTPEDKYLILACDGLFDRGYEPQNPMIPRKPFTNAEIAQFVIKNGFSSGIAAQLTNYAFDQESTDNITAIVVDLQALWPGGPSESSSGEKESVQVREVNWSDEIHGGSSGSGDKGKEKESKKK